MPRNRRGFTLIELTVTLAIVAVVSGLVIVRFDWGGPRQQAVGEARALANLIGLYRERAVLEERVYALKVDPSQGRYAIYRLNERLLDAATRPQAIRKRQLPEKFTMDVSPRDNQASSPIVLYFDRRRVIAPQMIDLKHRSGTRIRLHIDAFQSEVRLEEF